MESLDEVTDSDDRLDAIAGEYAERLRRGEVTTVEAYVAAHPDLADDLRLLLPSVAAMEELKQRHLTSSGRTGFLGLPTERLGDFRILRKIGRGGMGIVYEAEQESLGRRVALKTLPHAAFLLPHQVERFHQEAETAARLQHPNIVPIHSVGTEQGVHYFAMTRIDGVSLDRLLHRDGEDSADDAVLAATLAWLQPPAAATRGPRAECAGFWRRVALIGAQAADALECAHQHGVLHRDIKPSNLLLQPDGKVWVTDFGIAKVRDEDGMTRTGEFLGTLQYAPPEQIDGAFDARGDVYSLGLTLYELAARRPAFRGKSRVEFADRIKNGIPRSLRQVDPEIPRDLETIVGVATAFEPAHRYVSAALLAEDLRRFADGLPIRAREVAVVERLWRWSRRNPGTAALAVSTVLAFLVAAAVGWYSYLSTTSALDREREAKLLAQANLLQAQSATARTEANLSLSLRSLDDLYEAIVGDPTLGTLDEELSDVPVFPALSQKDLDLLRRTLAFYERFGSTNAADARLRRETARAFRRVGDVQRWTGALADADAAYGRALQLFGELLATGDDPGLLVEQAAVHKDLGILNADRGNLQASLRHLNRARQILGDEVRERPSERNRYELARVFNAMGANMTRQEIAPSRVSRMSPSMMARFHAVDCHQQAVALAESLVAVEPDLHHRLLLARSHRLLAQALSLAPDQRRSGAAIDASMRILADLAVEHGHSPGCQYELAEGNCLMGTLWREAAEGERRCREGLRQARELVASHPTVPQYQDLLARGLRRLADVLARAGRTDESFESLAESAGIRSGLWGRFPRAPHHLWELATVRQSMAAIESQRGNLAVARELLATMIQEVEGFGSDWSAFFYLGRILPDLRADLVKVLDALGEATAADKVRAASAASPWLDRYPPPWRPR